MDDQVFVGRAANTDITVASALALVDALNRCVEARERQAGDRGREPGAGGVLAALAGA